MKNVDTERAMLDRLNVRYGAFNGNGIRYTRAEHVKVTAGHDASRICDYMAIDLWTGLGIGSGPKLHGHEVKVSRSDWLTELKDPTKAESFAQFCDYWWLVVSDASIVKDDLPDGWGLMVAHGRSVRVAVQAMRRVDPVPMPRHVQATLTRAVTKTSVRLAERDGAMRFLRTRMSLADLTTADIEREVEARGLEALADRWERALAQFDYVAEDEDRNATKEWADSARDHARMLREGKLRASSIRALVGQSSDSSSTGGQL